MLPKRQERGENTKAASQTTGTTGKTTEELVATSVSSAPSGCDHWSLPETMVLGQTTELATTPADELDRKVKAKQPTRIFDLHCRKNATSVFSCYILFITRLG